jgi:AsmA protein
VLRVDRRTSQLSGKGTLKAPRVRLEPLQLEKFEAPFTIQGSRLVFQPMTFALYGGTHEGGVTVRLSDTPPQWITDNRVTSLDAGDFLKALNGSDQRLDGTASVTASLRGRVGQPLDRTLSGNMQMTVTDGVIRDFPMLAAINRALRLAEHEEGDTRFERLSGTFAIAAGQATTEDLVLQAARIRAEVKGRIGADRSLALRGVAVLSPDRSAQAIASIRELSALRNSSGELELPLTIGGTLDAPTFGLDLAAAVQKGLKNELQRQFRRIIRR